MTLLVYLLVYLLIDPLVYCILSIACFISYYPYRDYRFDDRSIFLFILFVNYEFIEN